MNDPAVNFRPQPKTLSSTIKRTPNGHTEEASVMEAMFMIVNKASEDIPFKLNPTQKSLDLALTGRDLIPKARQEGVSFYFLYRYLAACICQKNVRAVIVSHDRESTQKLLNRVKYAVETINGPKPVIKNMSANEITFPKTNSMIYIGTAGSKKFGRGDTITHLHCSEYAYWPNPAELLAGLLQAVPREHGEIAIESTGNGQGNDYHKRCVRAYSGLGRWTCHFFNWLHFPEYNVPLLEGESEEILSNPDLTMEEDTLIGTLTAEQIAFRREKLEEMGFDLIKFKQEYPITFDECFQASGTSIFTKVLYNQKSPLWKQIDHNMWILEGHPRPGAKYSLGADVSAGVRRDRSVMEIICIDTLEQVGEWISDRTEPDAFGRTIEPIARKFNDAYVTVEANNHGIVTLDVLMDIYPTYLIYSSAGLSGDGARDLQPSLIQQGFRTSARSKPMLIGKLRKYLAVYVTIYSELLKSELDSFIETETGQLEASQGCHDDTVIAMACATWGIERAELIVDGSMNTMPIHDDPFSMEYIIRKFHEKRTSYAISPQHATVGQGPQIRTLQVELQK